MDRPPIDPCWLTSNAPRARFDKLQRIAKNGCMKTEEQAMAINHEKRTNYHPVILLNPDEIIEAYLREGNLTAAGKVACYRRRKDEPGAVMREMNRQTLGNKLSDLGVDLFGRPTMELYTHEEGCFVPYQLSKKARWNVMKRRAHYLPSHVTEPPDQTLLRSVLERNGHRVLRANEKA